MSNQQQSHRHHQQYQRNSHRQQQSQQDRQQPGNPLERRREFLWRERVQLEMQVHVVIARATSLAQEWQLLQHKKADLAQQKPQIAAHILLSGLVSRHNLPGERLFHYHRERIAQEEQRIQQAIVCCNNEAAALHAQINVIDIELSLL
jgi:hypothetical protein